MQLLFEFEDYAMIGDCKTAALVGPERLVLRTPASLYGDDLKTVGEFTVEAGQSVPFVLSYGPSFQNPPPADRSFPCAGAYGSVLAPMERSVSGCRPWTSVNVAHHIEGFDLRSDGRNCRRGHDLADLSAWAGCGTGIIAIAGCATRRSRSWPS